MHGNPTKCFTYNLHWESPHSTNYSVYHKERIEFNESHFRM